MKNKLLVVGLCFVLVLIVFSGECLAGGGELQILDHHKDVEETSYGYKSVYVRGTAKNTGDEELSYPTVKVKWYDASGALLRTDATTVESLGAGETWNFEVQGLFTSDEVDSVDSYKISTEDPVGEAASGIVDICCVIVFGIVAVVAVIIVVVVMLTRRRKTLPLPVAPTPPPFQSPYTPPTMPPQYQQPPPTPVTPPPIQTFTSAPPQPAPITIRCPKCGTNFQITSPIRPLEVTCPKCGVKGTLR